MGEALAADVMTKVAGLRELALAGSFEQLTDTDWLLLMQVGGRTSVQDFFNNMGKYMPEGYARKLFESKKKENSASPEEIALFETVDRVLKEISAQQLKIEKNHYNRAAKIRKLSASELLDSDHAADLAYLREYVAFYQGMRRAGYTHDDILG